MVDENTTKPLVTITGVSGFIGSMTVKCYLEDGSYRVRGTVRDVNNAVKMDPLKKTLGEELFNRLELVQADLLDQASIDTALAGSTYVVHTASPFVLKDPEDEQVLIRPAVEGTLAVLRACKMHGVIRCIITSSASSIRFVRPENRPADGIFTEENWSETDAGPSVITMYAKSKTLAEKAAWDFQASLNESERFDIVVLNPASVMGPSHHTLNFASGDVMRGVMTSIEPVPRLKMGMVDVRDVARAHLQAVKVDAAKNRRFILVSRCAWRKEMA